MGLPSAVLRPTPRPASRGQHHHQQQQQQQCDIFPKLTTTNVSIFAALILIFFTVVNFTAITMTNCCESSNGRIYGSNSNTNIDCLTSGIPLAGPPLRGVSSHLTITTTTATAPLQRNDPKDGTITKTISDPPAIPPSPQPQMIPKTVISDNDSISSEGTLESTLLFLFRTIGSPHWNDTDIGEQHLNMKTVVNAYHRELYVDKEDITLATHGSIEKFSQLIGQVSRWQGPVSFVIYLNTIPDIKEFCVNMKTKTTPDFLKYVSIHVLLEKHGGTLPYPNNVLRNIAQRNIESNYFLLMDVDFIPSPGVYAYLKRNLDEQHLTKDIKLTFAQRLSKGLGGSEHFWAKLRNNTVFVLPAFERFPPHNDDGTTTMSSVTLDMVPQNQSELQSMLLKEEAATFHAYFPPGHYPTNYTKWFENHTADDEFSYPISYMKRFEPYVIAYKRGIPDFWDGFRGFGFNAATWFWELDLAGYRFEVIRDHFIVHLNHPGRKERNITEHSLPKQQLRRFMRYIGRKYHIDQMQLRYWKGRKYGNGTHVSLVCESCK